ncbi:MAG TPA: hypothetical protein VL356_12295 [Acidocella sp.]|jgi:hypothetical protein|nr:hypothetical protein [Acidocella sp.]
MDSLLEALPDDPSRLRAALIAERAVRVKAEILASLLGERAKRTHPPPHVPVQELLRHPIAA